MKDRGRHTKPRGKNDRLPMAQASVSKLAPAQGGRPQFEPSVELSPFSRQVKVSEVSEHGYDVKVTASPLERSALAKDYDLVGIASFEADFRIETRGGGRFNVHGVLKALVTETCIISLEPFDRAIEAEIDLDFIDEVKPAAAGRRPAGVEIEPISTAKVQAEMEAPEPIINGRIDLGAFAAEFLALNLDPYPKKPGVQFEDLMPGETDLEKISPFDVLRKLTGGE